MTTTIDTPPEAFAALPLPPVSDITPDRARGADCLWGGERLTPETAVDLGEQRLPDGTYWYPRACAGHASTVALQALFEHAGGCERCAEVGGRCETGVALYRIVRHGRRRH
ncbi:MULTISPECIES: hypothetical protein [unclassified Streptomyces]|uniref:hypothetical protein n=1 Tax=unclassified Streptomyces TaxID=2593676 RepID=UPI00380A9ECD